MLKSRGEATLTGALKEVQPLFGGDLRVSEFPVGLPSAITSMVFYIFK